MPMTRRRIVTLALAGGLLIATSAAAPLSAADENGLANGLRGGGLVILVRHGATFPDQADTIPSIRTILRPNAT
jgi:hypothetical protein